MDWRLEVIVIGVTDLDRAKAFYADRLGFGVDHDHDLGGGRRIVQLTPPGSACSIVFGRGVAEAEPGAVKGLQLSVADIVAARDELQARGFDPGPVRTFGEQGQVEGYGGDWNSFLNFADPDGNGWSVQQSPRLRSPSP